MQVNNHQDNKEAVAAENPSICSTHALRLASPWQCSHAVHRLPRLGSSGMTVTDCRCSGIWEIRGSGTACRVLMTFAVAVPEGNRSFSFRMVWVRSGTAQKTPRKAKASDQSTSWPYDRMTGPSGGFCSAVMMPIAGITPTNPVSGQGTAAARVVPVCCRARYHSCAKLGRHYE